MLRGSLRRDCQSYGAVYGLAAAEAFPFDEAPRYLQRDRDGINGEVFQRRVESLGFEEAVSAPRSPWQNPYVERLIGSICPPG